MILIGDALTELMKLEAESVDMMITSPPYYGLRNYHTEPVIWGAPKDCDHQWGDTIYPDYAAMGEKRLQKYEDQNKLF